MTLPLGFLFNISVPCRHLNEFPESVERWMLDERFSLPTLNLQETPEKILELSSPQKNEDLSSSESSRTAAFTQAKQNCLDVRLGWHEKGLALSVHVSGKTKPSRFDLNRPEISDGFHFCLDTRDVRDVHRASRFCHRFLFVPEDSTLKLERPCALWLPIHRAKAHPNPVDVSRFRMRGTKSEDGFEMLILIPSETLTGYEPDEHRRLGFHYRLSDNEFGTVPFQHPAPFPADEDPSLWSALELTGD